ncbi:MAG: O-antigen ligase family protein [Nitrococcus sp.]|nr:O-antigen ligase family protein [Nitrococcus sp.]
MHPNHDSMRGRIACWLGTIGLGTMVLGVGVSTAAINIGMALLSLATLLVVDELKGTLRCPELRVALALTGFLVVVTLIAGVREPALASEHRNYGWDLIRIAGLPAFAAGWWLSHGKLSRRALFVLFSIGVIAGGAEFIEWEHALSAPLAGRGLIHGGNFNSLSFLAGVLLAINLGAVLAPFRPGSAGSRRRWPLVLFGLAASLVAAFFLLNGQSRGAYLGVLGSLIVALGLRLWIGRDGGMRRQTITILVLVVLVGTVAYAAKPVRSVVLDRFHIASMFDKFLSGSLTSGEPETLDIRIKLWREGISAFARRPLLGYGPGAAPKLLSASEYTEIRHSPHFHNVWIQWGATTGVGGVLGFALLYGLLARASLRGALDRRDAFDWAATTLWAFVGIVTMVQLRYNQPAGTAVVVLLGGMAFATALRGSLDERAAN